MNRAINSVVVVGGGITAWSTAAALKRRISVLEVVVVSSPPPPDALADRMINTLPSIAEFHSDIGLSDEDTVVRARSGLRIGTAFKGWAEGLPDYMHAYGSYGVPVAGVAFHQLWLRHYYPRGRPFDSFAPAGEAGYALRLETEIYRQLIHDYSLHLGVVEQPGDPVDVELRGADGSIEALLLADGQRIEADLFIDCTGPAARIRSRMADRFDDWGRWLLCDRIIVEAGAPEPDKPLLDEITATAAGWTWRSSSPSATVTGSVFSSAHSADVEGANPIRQGRLSEPWVRNCVAIGDSAVMVEPLEWTNLHLAHSQIDRLVSMMPDAGFAPVEIDEYNRQCNAEADRVRDFLCMHYVTARRSEPFWKDASPDELPPSLAHTLSLFAERGRLPYYEEETFARDSWLAVLLGQGFLPRRIDPLADSVTAEQVEHALSSRRRRTPERLAPAQPSYRGSFLQMGQNAQP
ncbi:tryptophan 7-halogenase [Sphingomonas sp.]|uniref:tryptophan 7-halogenase n=1 Tax=Sphingomonas sp. TaxID=28214 RepID=UPI0038AA758B